jgi:hypothetical protein
MKETFNWLHIVPFADTYRDEIILRVVFREYNIVYGLVREMCM